MVLHTVRWKLRTLGIGHTSTLHDVANAFPSPTHAALDEMVDACAGEGDAALLKLRYGATWMIVRGHAGTEVAIRPGCGGLQGDSCMAPMFSARYDRGIEEWIARRGDGRRDGLYARDPISGREVQLKSTVFADDVQETNITETVEDLQRTVQDSGDVFDEILARDGMARNKDKDEHLTCMMGRGSVKRMREVRTPGLVDGRVVEKAKYLGTIATMEGRTSCNVDKRIQAAREGYFCMYGVWGRRGVRKKVVRMIFLANVRGAMLSGMEAEVPTQGELDKMESAICAFARKAMGSEGSYVAQDGVRRQHSNTHVRKWMGMPTVESELRARRLKWWKDIVYAPEENVQLLAALFGTMGIEWSTGVLTGTVPWVRQLVRDIEEHLAITNGRGVREMGLSARIEACGPAVLLEAGWKAWARRVRPEQSRQYGMMDKRQCRRDVGAEGGREETDQYRCGCTLEDGTECTYVGSKHAVSVHRINAHKRRDPVREMVATSQCPLCRKWFTTVRAAAEHVKASVRGGVCKSKDTARTQAVEVKVGNWTCRRCGGGEKGHVMVQMHCARHIVEMIEEEGRVWEGSRWWDVIDVADEGGGQAVVRGGVYVEGADFGAAGTGGGRAERRSGNGGGAACAGNVRRDGEADTRMACTGGGQRSGEAVGTARTGGGRQDGAGGTQMADSTGEFGAALLGGGQPGTDGTLAAGQGGEYGAVWLGGEGRAGTDRTGGRRRTSTGGGRSARRADLHPSQRTLTAMWGRPADRGGEGCTHVDH